MSRFQFVQYRTRKRSRFRRSRHFLSPRGSVVEWLKWSSRTIVKLVGIRQYGKMHEQVTKSQRMSFALGFGRPSGQEGALCFLVGDYDLFPARKMTLKIIFFRCSLFIPWKVIDRHCSIKMARYSPRSFFACSLTERESRHAKENNLANILRSWPYSITSIS